MRSVALAWFRRDLRLSHNPAWAGASQADEVAALVVLEPTLLKAAGPRRREAYLAAVAGLDESLKALGGSLWVASGGPAEIVPLVARRVGAGSIVVNNDVTRWAVSRDRRVREASEVPLVGHWGTVVHPPRTVLTNAGTLSRVFTPFYRRWIELPIATTARTGGASVIGAPAEFSLGATGHGTPRRLTSEIDAIGRLDQWLHRVDRYQVDRDLFHSAATSDLSAALHFGQLSPSHVVTTVGTGTPGRASYVRQLAWRDWYTHLTEQHPNIDRECLRPQFERIAWAAGRAAQDRFEAWRDGMTGYPIVDAAMRELASTGKMHNRLRLITASFLVKDLLVDWRRGERWFRRMLIDGDVAQNAGNWQWVAGVGADAAPYFRVFNPVTQSRKFDPKARYLRKLLPELSNLSDKDIHAPWEAAPLDLASANVTLGLTYPHPMVDHAEARTRALHAYPQAPTV